jgi:hypothetical protein
VGSAKADAYRQGVSSLGAGEFTAIQLATTLGENQVKLVPDVAVGGAGAGLTDALFARLLTGTLGVDGTHVAGRPPAV